MLQMVAPVLTLSILLLLVGCGAAWYLQGMQRRVAEELDRSIRAVLACEELVFQIRDVRTELLRLLLQDSVESLSSVIDRKRAVDVAIADAVRFVSPDQAERLKAVAKADELHFQTLKEMTLPATSTDFVQIRSRFNQEVLEPAKETLYATRSAAERHSARNEQTAQRIGLGLLILGICGSTAGLLGGYGIARALTRSVEQLGGSVRDMADTLRPVTGQRVTADLGGLPTLSQAMRQLSNQAVTVVQELQQTREQAVRSGQLAALGQLAAGMAHEIRNPLTSIRLLVQSAKEQQETLTLSELSVVDEEVSRINGILQSFLDFARPPELRKESVDVREQIEHIAQLIRRRTEQMSIHLDIIAEDAVFVLADRQQLQQVLINVLMNAIDAMPSGGQIEVTITTEQGCEPDEVAIRITDDGPGVPIEIEQKLFEPFVTTRDTGLGLGLTICRQIMESHGGSIQYSRATKGGAEFTLRFPAISSTPERTEYAIVADHR